jgi:hypothetical protein
MSKFTAARSTRERLGAAFGRVAPAGEPAWSGAADNAGHGVTVAPSAPRRGRPGGAARANRLSRPGHGASVPQCARQDEAKAASRCTHTW